MATRHLLLLAHIGYLLILGIVVVSTTAETTEHTLEAGDVESDGKSAVCQNNPNETTSKINAIDQAFGRSEVTDFVILIDRTNSISPKAFENTKETITALMKYLSRRHLVRLHDDYTRLTVVSFGAQSTVEFDGIRGDSGPVHACNFHDKLARIELGTTGRDDDMNSMNHALKVCINDY